MLKGTRNVKNISSKPKADSKGSKVEQRVAFFVPARRHETRGQPRRQRATTNAKRVLGSPWTVDGSAGRSLEIDADERIGTATCGAWSSRVSVTRPPQSPCDAQTCHYHATLSTMGSTHARTHARTRARTHARTQRSNCVIQRITRNTRQGRRAEGGADSLITSLSQHGGHTPVIVSFEVARH